MKSRFRKVVLAFALTLAGCGDGVRPEVAPAAAPEPDPALVERAVARVEREHEAALAAQAARLERAYEEQWASEREAYRLQLQQAEEERSRLAEELAQCNRRLAESTPAPEAAAPAPEPTTARVSIFQPPLPPARSMANDALFPLRIYDVAGRKAVSGSHTSLRFSTVEEDGRGMGASLPRKTRIPEPYQVEEYTYEVVFSVENLTDRTQSFNMRAGGVTRTAYLEPGETRTDVSITAMMGAPLIITTDGHRRRFPVPPAVEAPAD